MPNNEFGNFLCGTMGGGKKLDETKNLVFMESQEISLVQEEVSVGSLSIARNRKSQRKEYGDG